VRPPTRRAAKPPVDSRPLPGLQILYRARPASVTDGERVRVTASVGVACHPADALTSEDLVSSADSKLYIAKRRGGDRVQSAVDAD